MTPSRSSRIRHARPDESDALTALAVRSKAVWGYDDAFIQATRRDLIVSPGFIERWPTYVLDDPTGIAGFYGLSEIDDSTMELEFLFVEPDRRGRGHGRRLMMHAIETARGRGHHRIRVVSDPNAVGFYESMGGTRTGVWHSDVIPGRTLPIVTIALGRPDEAV